MQERLLTKHLSYVRDRLITHAEHVGIGKHANVLGLAREALVQYFLQDNLPSLVDFSTGEILDEEDNRSGQIDIVMQSSSSPKIKLYGDINLTLADTTYAAIEVKSNLTTGNWDKSSHLRNALENAQRVRKLKRNRQIFMRMNTGSEITLHHIPFFIFAYDGPEVDTLVSKLIDYGKVNQISQQEYWPDVITVLSKGYYVALNNGWLCDAPPQHACTKNINPRESLSGMYSYLCKIVEAANTQPYATRFHEYFRSIQIDD